MANYAQRVPISESITEHAASFKNGSIAVTDLPWNVSAAANAFDKTKPTHSEKMTHFNNSLIPECQWQGGIILLPVESLYVERARPRQLVEGEELEELARSIARNGLLQPIIVRKNPNPIGKFEIVAGERRWRAAKYANVARIPAIVLDLSDGDALEISLLENVQRKDITPIELATGYQRLISEFGHNQNSLYQKLGKSRSQIANTLRLLKLPATIQEMIQDGRLSASHGRTLLAAERPEELVIKVIAKGLNVRQTEKLVRRQTTRRILPGAAVNKPASGSTVDPALSALLGHKVTISYHGWHGRMTIHFDDLDGLAQIVKRLKVASNESVEPSNSLWEGGATDSTKPNWHNQTDFANPSRLEMGNDDLGALARKYDLPRPIQWDEKAYGRKPESRAKTAKIQN